MKTFDNIQQAAEYIKKHNESDKHNEMNVNDCVCFGLGVYAYKDECRQSGINVNNDSSAFHHLNESELITLLAWLQENDGYLYAV